MVPGSHMSAKFSYMLARLSDVSASLGSKSSMWQTLRVDYWKLKFYLRAELACWVFGAVWPLFCRIWVGFRPPGAIATDIQADSTLIRH